MSKSRSMGARPPQRALLLSLPNILTYGRIVAVPLVVFCVVGGRDAWRWIALALFIAASITDYLDGYLARMWQQQSSIGRMLDPIADKVLVAACLLALVFERTIGGVSIWAAVIILSREILVSGLREYLAELRVSVPVTRLAKWKTATQMVAIAFLLAGPAGDLYFPYTTTVGLVLLWLAALVTLYTGYDYFRAGLGHLLEDDER
ncbi:CDP-diacylglycerol--glycerol-3-phosphate 3-phosphatidyltransferase [Kaistia geumhonensis]|uniref:CDP-diacylglycerol--glycerol-3-phosphate 3-phosphatidyltransferase n=2 Tax=Kaistia geumhonensis TaxID=410839 RepID=A0ABU0M2M8_9HYPH|nr:CDP-diacylglycerol--glycerol-3-phosphate 3-phosphatidyltransferase [Kaistia geumhonensis]MCX5479562.1 CDP-diacylglycerol--glycerol-3-phosphate 3-phosphatidyltransferase [Kaistia geumhonensis]MDQ0515215.1 cardiolipin synthase [Kaistia geumhonensis]